MEPVMGHLDLHCAQIEREDKEKEAEIQKHK